MAKQFTNPGSAPANKLTLEQAIAQRDRLELQEETPYKKQRLLALQSRIFHILNK